MKKITLVITFIVFAFVSNAITPIDETFTGCTVGALANQDSWTTAGTLTTGAGRTVNSTALTYSNSGGTYVLSGIGKSINVEITSCSDYKSYKTLSSGAINSGVVYVSYLYKAGTVQSQTGIEIFGLASGTSQGPRIWVGKTATSGNWKFGITRLSTTSADCSWNSGEYNNVNEVMLLVMKYDFSTSVASFYINPVIGGSEPATPAASAPIASPTGEGTTGRSSLNNLWFRSTGSSSFKYNIGNIRVSTSWADAVAAQTTASSLPAPVVGTATSITGEGFTANWTSVSDAQGYKVKVYQSTTLVGTFSTNGNTGTSLVINGLLPNATYTYKVIAIGDGTNFSDSGESAASESFTTLNTGIDAINTNFGDGTWGETAVSYTSGSYPTTTINGFNLVKAFLQGSSLTCQTGENHVNRILLDKSSQSAALEFPVLKTVGEVEIHAATGTDAMSFRLEEWVNNQWQVQNTYTTRKSPDSIYVIPLIRSTNTKLRIANNTGSGLYIYKILTRTLQETVDLTLKSSSPTENEVVFSNLKKTITLTFNKNIEKMNGTILLNDVSIPLADCTIKDNIATIPVTLTTTSGSNKNYTLTVSAGAFGEAGNNTNLSRAITVNFQTIKSVSYPSNYNGLIDVVYKNVNSPNCRMDVYYPTNPLSPVPCVINMHGGGWVSGAKEEQGGFSMYFNVGYAVVNVEYRMRNEIEAPAAVEDVRAAMHYVLNHAQEWNIDTKKIIFQGGSAGGHLALTAGYLQNDRRYDNEIVQYQGEINVMAVIDKYGAADLTTFLPVYPGMVLWFGSHAGDTDFIKSLSPVDLINSHTPPTYIIHGDADPTIPYSQSVTLYAALQNAGIKSMFTTVPGGGHGGFSSAYNTQMETEVINFLRSTESTVTGVENTANKTNLKAIVQGKQVVLLSNDETTTSVFDCLGNEIMFTKLKTFDIAQKGLYILKIKNGQKESVQKIIIQ